MQNLVLRECFAPHFRQTLSLGITGGVGIVPPPVGAPHFVQNFVFEENLEPHFPQTFSAGATEVGGGNEVLPMGAPHFTQNFALEESWAPHLGQENAFA